jgi:hypothetical protein
LDGDGPRVSALKVKTRGRCIWKRFLKVKVSIIKRKIIHAK